MKKKSRISKDPVEEKKKPTQSIQIKSFGTFSLAGFNSEKPNKTNQDSSIIYSQENFHLFGVADGHGHYGDKISNYISSAIHFINIDNIPEFYISTHDHLPEVADSCYSGSTLSLAVFTDKLIISNVGDSQIILGSLKPGAKNKVQWDTRLVSEIHNLENREEAQRITQSGGRITWGTPSRLWLKNENVPGLAITRSIGDTVASRIGVIPFPYISNISLSPADKWIIVCSDGVTDYIDYSTISKTITSHWAKNQAQNAAEKIVKAARKNCSDEDFIDDITCVVVFFECS